MENIYSRQGLKAVINASGRMTKLGVSTISQGVGEALMEAAGNYVVIEELFKYAGKQLGAMVGTADACVTSSASAGIALAVASLICRDDVKKVKGLYGILPTVTKREVILLKGQNVDYGAPVGLMIQLGGGKVVEAGFANGSDLADIASVVNENTLAVVYVKSHHCVQKEMVDAESVIRLANQLGVPCIVDAAAEEDLAIYAAQGADFVCYSGAKAIEGPTSGFVACKSVVLADCMRLQYQGIGRAMKIGKEGVMGLLKAVSEYLEGKHAAAVSQDDLEAFAEKLNRIPGIKAGLVRDEAGRDIYRCRIDFDRDRYGMSAKDVVKRLQEGDVAVFTRDYQADLGSVAIDPRPLLGVDELDFIYRRLWELSEEGNAHERD